MHPAEDVYGAIYAPRYIHRAAPFELTRPRSCTPERPWSQPPQPNGCSVVGLDRSTIQGLICGSSAQHAA